MNQTMQAVIVNAPHKFSVQKVPAPKCDKKGLLLKVDACGLCGSDLRTLRSGHHRVTLPWIIGHEICGTVVEIGAEYKGQFQQGDRLAVGPLAFCGVCHYCQNAQYELCSNYKEIAQAWPGGFAEYIALPPECLERGTIQKAPQHLDSAIAAIAEPLSSCLNAQEKGAVSLGDTVLILGAGPIGCFHISIARARGADKIFIADIQDSRLKFAELFEPDVVINSTKTDIVEKVREHTNGLGADVIITANPDPKSQVQAVHMAAKGGRILLFGGLPKGKSSPGIDMNIVHYQALQLIGTTIFAPRHFGLALKLLASGRVPGEKLISHKFPLNEFEKGANMALNGEVLKAVFLP